VNFLWTKWIYALETRMNTRLLIRKKEQEGRELVLQIKKAYAEWQAAEDNFHEITGKEQVDYAIFAINSAEKRYENLIREAKSVKIAMSEKKFEIF
jgi:hypothetical protein